MANLVEFIVRIRDMASGPLQKIASSGAGSFGKLQQSVDKITGKFRTMGMSISDIDKRLNDLMRVRRVTVDSSQLRRINKEIDQLQSKKTRLEGGSGSSFGLGGMLRTGLAIAGIGSLAYMGVDIMKAGIGRQMDLTSLQVLLGKEPGNMVNNQLIDFARKSIYGNEVFNEGKLLAGSGVAAKNIMPIMKMIGDIALGDKERMKSLALAFSETSTRGALSGINERMFLQGGLFNPIEQLHKMTGRSLADLKKDMEKGKISINDLVKAMEYATGPMGRWHDSMKQLEQTPAGQWTAFTGTVRTLAGTIGLKLLPVLGSFVSVLNEILNNDDEMRNIAWAIGAMTVAWAAYSIQANWAAISAAAAEAAAAWPLVAVGGIVYALSQISQYTDGVTASNDKMKKSMADTADETGMHFNALKGTFDTFVVAIQWVWLSLKNVWEGFAKVGDDLMHGRFKDALHDLWNPSTEASATGNKIWDNYSWKIGGYDIKPDSALDNYRPKGKYVPKDYMSEWAAAGDKTTVPGKYDPKAGNVPTTGGVTPGADTTAAITGGGVRSITINVAKFQDKTEIHTASFKESLAEVEDLLKNMFLRVTGSAASQLN